MREGKSRREDGSSKQDKRSSVLDLDHDDYLLIVVKELIDVSFCVQR